MIDMSLFTAEHSRSPVLCTLPSLWYLYQSPSAANKKASPVRAGQSMVVKMRTSGGIYTHVLTAERWYWVFP